MDNPLDAPGTVFALEVMNPNPGASKAKNGPVYRVSFEVEHDDWLMFMDANTKGMVIELQGMVTQVAGTVEKPKGGAVSKNAGMLCQDPQANDYAARRGYKDFKAMIYDKCCIESRAELDHDQMAAQRYEFLKLG